MTKALHADDAAALRHLETVVMRLLKRLVAEQVRINALEARVKELEARKP